MTYKLVTVLFALSLLLAACGGATATAPVIVTASPTNAGGPTSPSQGAPSQAIPTQANPPGAYPAPGQVTPDTTLSAYPAPGTPSISLPQIPPSGYEPQPGDESLQRDVANLELDNSELIVTASHPSQVNVNLSGSLPDPCHKLRVVVTPPDAQNMINLEVFSLVDSGSACTTVIKPFTASIPLGSYTSGHFTVAINGQKLGEFDAAFDPQPDDAKLTRGDVFIDTGNSQLTFPGNPDNKVSVVLKGNLPDPCHQLRIVSNKPDSQNKINIEVYSVFDPKTICTTVVEPFYVILPLESLPAGHYTVNVNSQPLGEFNW